MENQNITAGLNASGLYAGQVLSPEATNRLFAAEKIAGSSIQGYVIAASMSTRMHARTRANPSSSSWRLKAFETPNTQMLLTLTVQASDCQARLVMHLADRKVKEMLRGFAASGRMEILLIEPGHAGTVRFCPQFYPEDAAPLLALGEENVCLPRFDTLKEMATFATQLLYAKDVVVCPGMPRTLDVTVTSIIPAVA